MTPGDTIGPYLVVEPLGAGGMGEVYRARDTRLDREVALKRLADPDLDADVVRRRLLREGRAAAALTHPGIAGIYDVLDLPAGLFIVMEYVPGESLAARLRRGPLPVEAALDIGRQAAEALAAAHGKGIVHRDLKPGNIQLTPDGRVKILDFGVARLRGDEAGPAGRHQEPGSQAGRVVGTPGYMAPEQLAGAPGDERMDVYALGVVLFEMIVGRRPFDAEDAVGKALKALEGKAPLVSDFVPGAGPDVSSIVARAMARDPRDRFQSAADMARELARADSRRSGAPTVSSEDVAVARRRPRALAAWLTVGGLIAASALAAALVVSRWWSSPVSAHASTVALLPFKHADPADEAIAVGLTDAVETRLSSVAGLHLVDAASAGEASGAPDVVARALGAAFVVDGALRRTGSTLTLDLSLVDPDGTRRPVGRYEGDVDRPFDFHRRVADGLVAALNQAGAVARGAAPRPGAPTADQEAFADYAQARVFLERPDVPGNLDHAIQLFQAALSRDKQFAQASAGLGEAYWSKYQETKEPEWTARATAAILDALRLDPGQPEVRISLAVMYQGLGKLDDAESELNNVIRIQPQNDDPHRILGGIYADSSRFDDAERELTQAIALRPNYWRNHSELGYAYFRAGRLDDAIAAYTRVTELQPDSRRGFHMLGTVEQSAGRLADAVRNYEKANAISPTFSTFSNLGTAQYWQGNFAAAKQAYERALALSPGEPEVLANLGDANRRLGDRGAAMARYREAIDAVNKRLMVNPTDPFDLASLALYQAKAGRGDDAAAAIARAVAINSNDGEVLYLRALVLALGGRNADACQALAQAIDHGASVQVARHADELRELKGCPAYDRIRGQG